MDASLLELIEGLQASATRADWWLDTDGCVTLLLQAGIESKGLRLWISRWGGIKVQQPIWGEITELRVEMRCRIKLMALRRAIKKEYKKRYALRKKKEAVEEVSAIKKALDVYMKG